MNLTNSDTKIVIITIVPTTNLREDTRDATQAVSHKNKRGMDKVELNRDSIVESNTRGGVHGIRF